MVRPEVRIMVTPACNLRCYYCYHQGQEAIGPYRDISLAQVKDIASVSSKLGISHIHLTGGDPSLREDLYKIIRVIKQNGIEDVAISSNGVAFTRENVNKLIKAGLDELHCHMPSLDKKSYCRITGRRDITPKEIADIIAYTSDCIPVRFNVPVSSRNYNSIHSLLDYSLDNHINVGLISIATPPEHADNFDAVCFKDIKKLFLEWSLDKEVKIVDQDEEYGESYKVNSNMRTQLIHSPARRIDDEEEDFKLSNRIWVGANRDRFLLSFGVDHEPYAIKDLTELELLIKLKYKQ